MIAISDILLNKVSRFMMYRSLRVQTLKKTPKVIVPDHALLLYVHIPFCEELCPYCSFFKVKFDDNIASDYFLALEKEIISYSKMGFVFDEVYVGGGTPTVKPEHLGKIIKLIRSLWDINEVSVETNPNHLKPSILKVLKDSGVNRLSVGVQTFDDNLLKKMKRFKKYGSSADIQQQIIASSGIFDTLNVDMIFNFPDQSMEMLKKDLDIINKLQIDQVTFYPLMSSSSVKDKMTDALGKYGSGNEKIFYKTISKNLLNTYRRTSAWCYTRKGNMIDEYIVTRDHYIGVGAGSFSYLAEGIYASTFSIRNYIERINKNMSPIDMGSKFRKKEKMLYSLLMSLFGGKLNIKTFRKTHGPIWFIYLFVELSFLVLSRGITIKKESIVVTEKGRYFTVSLMRDFFTIVNNIREQCRNQLADKT
jgi:menaquinone C8-methyltransferase